MACRLAASGHTSSSVIVSESMHAATNSCVVREPKLICRLLTSDPSQDSVGSSMHVLG